MFIPGAVSPLALDAQVSWDHLTGHDELIFGLNPDDPAFGGQTFASQAGTPWYGSAHQALGGAPNWDNDFGKAHSEYWNRDSLSLNNIGHIVAGQPTEVSRPGPP